jgi:hypothetical protein
MEPVLKDRKAAKDIIIMDVRYVPKGFSCFQADVNLIQLFA